MIELQMPVALRRVTPAYTADSPQCSAEARITNYNLLDSYEGSQCHQNGQTMWQQWILMVTHLTGHIVLLNTLEECEVQSHGETCADLNISQEQELGVGEIAHAYLEQYNKQSHVPSLNRDFLLVTVATNQTDGYKRFIRSAKIYDIPVKVLGMGEKWKGGDIRNGAAGGFKVNLLKKELAKFQNDKEKIILFTDSYDVVVLASADAILDQFERFNARVLFSTEGFCWPDESLASKYPTVTRGKRFLNSGGFIGYASELYRLITSSKVDDTDDDQLFYTKIYLNEKLRNKHKIKLDHKAEVFQCLNGAVSDVELRFKGREAYLQNTAYNTVPLVVHGNGRSKMVLNTLGNYLAKSWNSEDGCLSCWDDSILLEDKHPSTYPVVLIAVFIEQATPFLEEFLAKLNKLEYPKDKIHFFVHNAVKYHSKLVEEFLSEHGKSYRSVKRINPEDNIEEWLARNLAIEQCLTKNCEYYFNVDGEAHLDNPHALRLLIEQNRSIVAPILVRPFKAWSNFWGALTSDGFYARSMDYMEIIHNERR
uniref:PLOD1-3-like GT domain-containing protein n=1 Tax=Timema douglasi TaxID=61478 RepID=A0A7R8Z966_TIMDO|nr:unnamed protein product [Timema douglasi]